MQYQQRQYQRRQCQQTQCWKVHQIKRQLSSAEKTLPKEKKKDKKEKEKEKKDKKKTSKTSKTILSPVSNGGSDSNTVNQQILAAIKFGVSQNKVIWLLLNLASPCPVCY